MAINIEIRVYHDTGDTSSNPAAAQAGCTATCISYYSGTKTYTGGHPKPGESGGTTSVAYTNYQLTATPATGWYFKGWDVITRNYVTGGLDSQGNVRTDIEIQTERTYHSGTNPYPANTTATDYEFPGDLAEANPGYDWPRHTFKWEIIAVYAQFEQGTPPPPTYTITTAVSPSGAGTTTGDGTYNSGTTATLTATPNSGYHFLRWELNGATVSTSATYSFSVTASGAYTAVFEQDAPTTYTISTSVSPAGSGTTTGDGSYNLGSTATITATPNNLFRFLRWELNGATVSTSSTYSFSVTGNATYTAVFEVVPSATIEVQTYSEKAAGYVAPDAIVSINGQSDNDNDFSLVVARGSTVVVGATAYGGLEDPQTWPVPMYFVGWLKYPDYDTILSDSLQYAFTTSQADYYLRYLAKYAAHYTLNTSVRPVASAGTVSLSPLSRYGNNLYPEYSNVTLTAVPNSGWKFKHWIKKDTWSEEFVSSATTYWVEITEDLYDIAYIAVFEWDGTDLLVNSSNLGSPVQLVYDPATNLLVADY